MNLLESYHQTYAYDIGNNLIFLSHQAQSNTWQQTISPHPHSNRGTENNNPNNFDTNGNLLNLDNIGKLNWHYNNTLAKLVKQDKINAIEYYVYDHQGNRVRTVIESNHQAQSQKTYLPSLDILTNINNPQINTLHIGTHILSEQTKDSAQTRYQLSSHLQTNTLELNDQAKIISYEHYYPYGGTAIIAGKDKTQVQQKRYRYTGKERDDSSGLCYYGARYLAPWLARWISPDLAGSVDGLNLYVYVGNNPLKYTDPTGHGKTDGAEENVINTIGLNEFLTRVKGHASTNELNIWIGERHSEPSGYKLLLALTESIDSSFIGNLVLEGVNVSESQQLVPIQDLEGFRESEIQKANLTNKSIPKALETANYKIKASRLIGGKHNFMGSFIGRKRWANPRSEISRITGSLFAVVGAAHLLTAIIPEECLGIMHQDALPVQDHLRPDTSIALIPQKIISYISEVSFAFRGNNSGVELALWVRGKNNTIDDAFLVVGRGKAMKRLFSDIAKPILTDLSQLGPIRGPLPCAANYHAIKETFV
ncbi:RHS repeat-associated core domain-containing protein [Bathymodiolus thermophilus thioautotrophic gill symbiont]|uniref:Toxin subunit n=2 Tax=Bathymodiolus thermophilus thioautotrophic gill symbiont TaxID=2360 RepID=A0A8H8XBP6_9GAMM|nr:RHS repeat-associated core domain-containing protein [Bathymodiolus thermophilus thioautotrophic gill symbiont]CAB5496561.1 Putative toxin subunit [Bathymodiolus thermophilus thioautotrophic gill symbiont]